MKCWPLKVWNIFLKQLLFQMLQFWFRSGHSPLCGLAEIDDHDDKEDEEDAPTEEEEKQEPASSSTKRWTKTQLYAKYKGRGPHRMAYDFLHTDSLRQELTIICEIGGVLQSQYARDLDSQNSDRLSRFRWVAQRATCGSAKGIAVKILLKLFSLDFHAKLRLIPHVGKTLKADRAEIALLDLAFKFATNLAANVVWGRQLYSHTLPFCCGALLSGSGSVKCK